MAINRNYTRSGGACFKDMNSAATATAKTSGGNGGG